MIKKKKCKGKKYKYNNTMTKIQKLNITIIKLN